MELDDPASSEDDLTAALRLDDRDPILFLRRGLSLFLQSEHSAAVSDFESALALDPSQTKLPEIYYHLGLAHASIGDHGSAVEAFTAALGPLRSLLTGHSEGVGGGGGKGGIISGDGGGGGGGGGGGNGESKESKSGSRGGSHGDEGGDDDGGSGEGNGNISMAFAADLQQTMVDVYHERAKALQLMRRYDDAIRDFTSVIERRPLNAHAFFRRAFAYKATGDYEKAADDFETAKLMDPTNPDLVVNYTTVHDAECIVLCDPGREKRFV